MTIAELNELIERGAAQPGVRDVEDLMRLCRELDEQARNLADLYVMTPTTASSSSLSPLAAHADVG
jgi:hypothetical protein